MTHLIPHIDQIEVALKAGAEEIRERLQEIVGSAAWVDTKVKQRSSDYDTMYWDIYVEVGEEE